MMNEFAEDIKIDLEALASEFQRQPSIYAYYAMELVTAEEQERKIEIEIKSLEAQLYIDLREELSKTGKPTNDAVFSARDTDPELIALRKSLVVAKRNKALARLRVDALNQKKDMLIQLGAQQRSEMNNHISQGSGQDMTTVR